MDVEPVTFPELLEGLSSEELAALETAALAEFNTLNEGDDLSNETLERMETLAAGIESVRAQIAAAAPAPDAAERRAELAGRLAPATEPPAGDPAPADQLTSGEPAPAPVPAGAGELVAAAVGDARSHQPPAVRPPERGYTISITAAADIPGVPVGAELDFNTLAEALHLKARGLGDSKGAETVYPVATVHRPFGDGYRLDDLNESATWDAIAAGTAPRALTASGGWCAPSQILYDLLDIECGGDKLFQLPTFQVTRGGIRWPVFVPFDNALAPAFVHTEADDIAGATKPCITIPCPTFTECRLDAVGLCITAGNLMSRAYPEQQRWFINRAMRAYERQNSIRKLNLVLADTVAVAIGGTFGAASALVSSLLLQAADYREVNGLCCGESLDVLFPCWVQDLVRADIARQEGTFNIGSLPTDAQVDSWFAAANLNVTFINHWQDFGTHPALTWPATVEYLLGYPGSYVQFDGGRLDLGVVRDSVLNSTNDFTAVWFEAMYCVGRRGPQSRLVTVPVCPDGLAGGDGVVTCPAA